MVRRKYKCVNFNYTYIMLEKSSYLRAGNAMLQPSALDGDAAKKKGGGVRIIWSEYAYGYAGDVGFNSN